MFFFFFSFIQELDFTLNSTFVRSDGRKRRGGRRDTTRHQVGSTHRRFIEGEQVRLEERKGGEVTEDREWMHDRNKKVLSDVQTGQVSSGHAVFMNIC